MAFKRRIRPRTRSRKKKRKETSTLGRFPERRKGYEGRLIDYKEVELLRKFLTSSNKLMSRKRSGTSAREQRALRTAIKHARFLALIPYTGP